jgi:hypothetical protein
VEVFVDPVETAHFPTFLFPGQSAQSPGWLHSGWAAEQREGSWLGRDVLNVKEAGRLEQPLEQAAVVAELPEAT